MGCYVTRNSHFYGIVRIVAYGDICKNKCTMVDYIRLFKETLDRKHIMYCYDERLLVFTRKYSSDRMDDLQMRFIFLLFPSSMMVVVSIRHALDPEQVASSRLLFEEANKDLHIGEFSADNRSKYICFSHSFDPLVGEEWCTEVMVQMQEFIIDYTTEIVPPVMLGIFARATGLVLPEID